MKSLFPVRAFAIGVTFSTLAISGSPAFELADELKMTARQYMRYLLVFAARPDARHFQISRLPTPAWPKRETFYLKIGDVSGDRQFRVDSLEENVPQGNGPNAGATSVLTITHLETGAKHKLEKKGELEMRTYFAELQTRTEPEKTFYVKEGETFTLPNHPALKFKLLEAKENSSRIEVFKDGRPFGEQTIEKE